MPFSGPGAAVIPSDFGADVIKVEPANDNIFSGLKVVDLASFVAGIVYSSKSSTAVSRSSPPAKLGGGEDRDTAVDDLEE